MANISNEEVEKRVEFVYRCQTDGLLKCQIKEAFKAEFGPTHHVTIERYITKAKQLRKKLDGLVDQEFERQRLVDHLYVKYVTNPKISERGRLKAIDTIADLQGLKAPEKHEHTATVVHERKPIVIDFAELRRLRDQTRGLARSDSQGQPLHDAGANGSTAALPGTDRD